MLISRFFKSAIRSLLFVFLGAIVATSSVYSKTINVLVVSSPSASGLKAVAKTFTEKTGIRVKFTEVPYTQVVQTLLLAKRAGSTGFDVSQYDSGFLAELMAGEVLAPLDELIASSPSYKYDDFSTKVKEYTTYKGVTYGLNLSTEPYVLWYRTDLFKELGLNPPSNMKEYIENAKALKAAGYYGSDSGYGPGIGGYYWLQHMKQSGVDFLNLDTCKFNVTNHAFVSATEEFLSLIPYTPSTAVNGGGNEMTSAFIQENVGQEVNASGYFSMMNDPKRSKVVGKFKAALVPGNKWYEGGKTTLVGWLIGVMDDAKNPKEGWAFMMHALDINGVGALVAAGAPPPGRISFGKDPTFLKEHPYWPVLLEAAAMGEPYPYIPEFPAIQTIMAQTLNGLATSESPDVVKVLAKMEVKLDRTMRGNASCP